MLAIVFLGIYYAVAGFGAILLLKTPLEERLGEYRAAHPEQEQ